MATKLFGIIIMGVVRTLMASYTVAMMGATDEGVDLTGTDYEAQYEAQTEISLANNAILGVLPIIFTGIVVVGAAGFLIKATH